MRLTEEQLADIAYMAYKAEREAIEKGRSPLEAARIGSMRHERLLQAELQAATRGPK